MSSNIPSWVQNIQTSKDPKPVYQKGAPKKTSKRRDELLTNAGLNPKDQRFALIGVSTRREATREVEAILEKFYQYNPFDEVDNSNLQETIQSLEELIRTSSVTTSTELRTVTLSPSEVTKLRTQLLGCYVSQCKNDVSTAQTKDSLSQMTTLVTGEMDQMKRNATTKEQADIFIRFLDSKMRVIQSFIQMFLHEFGEGSFNPKEGKRAALCDNENETTIYRFRVFQTLQLLYSQVRLALDMNTAGKPSPQIAQLMKNSLAIYPGDGYVRFSVGNMSYYNVAYMDAVYYYLSAMDAMAPFLCKERLSEVFEQGRTEYRKLESIKKMRKVVEVPDAVVKLVVFRFLHIIGVIVTRVGLDNISLTLDKLDSCLFALITKWDHGIVSLTHSLLSRMVIISILTLAFVVKNPVSESMNDPSMPSSTIQHDDDIQEHKSNGNNTEDIKDEHEHENDDYDDYDDDDDYDDEEEEEGEEDNQEGAASEHEDKHPRHERSHRKSSVSSSHSSTQNQPIDMDTHSHKPRAVPSNPHNPLDVLIHSVALDSVDGQRVSECIQLLTHITKIIGQQYCFCSSIKNELLPSLSLACGFLAFTPSALFFNENYFSQSNSAVLSHTLASHHIPLSKLCTRIAPALRVFNRNIMFESVSDRETGAVNTDCIASEINDLIGCRSVIPFVKTCIPSSSYVSLHHSSADTLMQLMRTHSVSKFMDVLLEGEMLEVRGEKVFALEETFTIREEEHERGKERDWAAERVGERMKQRRNERKNRKEERANGRQRMDDDEYDDESSEEMRGQFDDEVDDEMEWGNESASVSESMIAKVNESMQKMNREKGNNHASIPFTPSLGGYPDNLKTELLSSIGAHEMNDSINPSAVGVVAPSVSGERVSENMYVDVNALSQIMSKPNVRKLNPRLESDSRPPQPISAGVYDRRDRSTIQMTEDEAIKVTKIELDNRNNRFLIVLDVSNICMRHGNQMKFSTAGLKIVIKYYESRGHKIIGFVTDKMVEKRISDRGTKPLYKAPVAGRPDRQPDNIGYLQRLVKEEKVISIPAGDYDDSYMIEYARTHNGIIVSNDLFRDYFEFLNHNNTRSDTIELIQSFLKTHRLSYTFMKNEFLPNPDFKFPEFVFVPDSNPSDDDEDDEDDEDDGRNGMTKNKVGLPSLSQSLVPSSTPSSSQPMKTVYSHMLPHQVRAKMERENAKLSNKSPITPSPTQPLTQPITQPSGQHVIQITALPSPTTAVMENSIPSLPVNEQRVGGTVSEDHSSEDESDDDDDPVTESDESEVDDDEAKEENSQSAKFSVKRRGDAKE